MTPDEKQIDQLVDRFLAWPLPKSVCSDTCVTDKSYPYPRSGTNLLNADEAREMFNYLLTKPCDQCNGIGMIGGFVNAESGYDGEPCPSCIKPIATPDEIQAAKKAGYFEAFEEFNPENQKLWKLIRIYEDILCEHAHITNKEVFQEAIKIKEELGDV